MESRPSSRGAALCVGATALCFGIAVPLFLVAVSLCRDLRKVAPGMIAVAGIAGVGLVGMCLLALLFLVPEYLWKGVAKGLFRVRALRVLALLCLLYPALYFLQALEFSFRSVTVPNVLLGSAGLAAGVALLLVERRWKAAGAMDPASLRRLPG